MGVRWNTRSYTKDEFRTAWTTSESISEVANKLDCNRSGNGFYTLRNAAIELGLNQDHMPTTRTKRSTNSRRKRSPLSDILIENSTYSNTDSLRKRLIREGLKTEACEICTLSEWMEKKIPLALDHINGVRSDNRIDNLRVICYNCHGQTETFGSRNRVKKILSDSVG